MDEILECCLCGGKSEGRFPTRFNLRDDICDICCGDTFGDDDDHYVEEEDYGY